MNTNYLLRSSTIRTALIISISLSLCILLFSSDGLYGFRKRRLEMSENKYQLKNIYHTNLELAKEVNLLLSKDSELYESLARQQGLVRPGETIYAFNKHDIENSNENDN